MKKEFSLLCLSMIILVSQSGCSMWNTTFKNDDTPLTQSNAELQSSDDDQMEEENDWSFVGDEARGKTHVSSDPGKKGFVEKYFKTEQTRQIEQNLGVY